MTVLDRPDNTLYFGKGGSGKSTLVRHHLAGHRRVILHDPNGEDENREIASRVSYTVTDLIEQVRKRSWVVAWRGYEIYRKAAFEIANRVALAAEDCTVVWEEVERFTDAGAFPDHAYDIIHVGRHRGLRSMATARRPHRVARDHTSNVQRVIAFQITEPRDIKFIGDTIDDQAKAETLRTLRDYEALDWQDGIGATPKKAPFL